MRLMCAERDRLWAQYEFAVEDYIESVKALKHKIPDSSEWDRVDNARSALEDILVVIKQHCDDHGCDKP